MTLAPPMSHTTSPDASQLAARAVMNTRRPDRNTRNPKMISGSVLDIRWARLECSSGNVRMSRIPSRLRGRSPKVRFREWNSAVLRISIR